MFTIILDDLQDESILRDLYLNMGDSNLYNNFFIINKPNLKITLNREELLLDKIISHATYVDLNQLENYTENELEDFILTLLELNLNIIIKEYEGTNEVFYSFIHSIIKSFKLKFIVDKPINFNQKIDLKNITYNNYNIIKEIFEENTENSKYYLKQFLFYYIINKKGIVFDEKGKEVLNLNNDSILKLILQMNTANFKKYHKELLKGRDERILDDGWYEPYIYLFNRDDKKLKEKIINYKYRVFKLIQNIKPSEYQSLNEEVVKIMNKNGYIQFDDIMSIIRSDENGL